MAIRIGGDCAFRASSTHKGINQRSKDVTKTQQRPESPTVTLTWHASKCKMHKFHQRYSLYNEDVPLVEVMMLMWGLMSSDVGLTY